MKKLILLFFILGGFNTIAVRADEPLCNDLLSGLSVKMKASIQELAKLRFGVDQSIARGMNDAVTRALMAAFNQKQIEILEASGLSQDSLSSLIKTEIRKLQHQSEIETNNQNKVRAKQIEETSGIETKIQEVGNLNEARGWAAQNVLPNDQVFVSGGRGTTGVRFSSIERFDLNTGKSEKVGDLIQARERHTQSVLADKRLLIAGGYHPKPGMLTSIEIFNPITQTFEAGGDLLEARAGHTQSVLPDGRILIVGGESEGVLSSVEVYDPRTKKSEKIGDLLEARKSHTQSLLPDGRVLVSGGMSRDYYGNDVYLSSIEVIDPVKRTIQKVGNLNESRAGHAESVLSDGRVLISGGSGGVRGFTKIRSSIEVIDLNTGKIEKIGDLLEAREQHGQGVLPDDRIVVFAGNGNRPHVRLVEVFDPSTGKSENIGELKAAKYAHSFSVLSKGQIVVIGGYKTGTVSTVELIQVGRK